MSVLDSKAHSRQHRIIRFVFERSGLTQESFARRIGITQASLSNILAGKTGPRHETVLAITETFGLDPNVWFQDDVQPDVPANAEHFVPVIGKVAAGGTRVMVNPTGQFEGEPITWIPRPDVVCHPSTAALQIDGDSMAPAYPHGSYVYFEPDLPIRKGHKVVVFTRKGYAYFKLWDEDAQHAILRSLNPAHAHLLIPKADVIDVRRVRFSREEV